MKRDRLGLLLIVVTTAAWGGAWVTARGAAHDAPALWMAVGRFATAALALLPIAALLRRPVRLGHDRGTWLHLAAMALTGAIGYNLFFLWGIERAPASDGAVITPGLAGFAGAMAVWVMDGIRPRRWAVRGGLLSLLGAAVIGYGAWTGTGGTERIVGNALFVVAALVWGVYTALGRRLSGRIPAVEGVFWATAIAVLFWTPVAWAASGPPQAHWAQEAYWNMAYLGLVGTAIGFVTWYLAVQRLGADRAGPGLGLVPFFGVLLAVLFLDEHLLWTHVAGGAVVVLGIALSGFDGRLQLRLQRRFDRSLDEVWAALSDFGGLHRYSPDLASSDIIDGPPFGIGTTRRNVFARPQGRVTGSVERITAIDGHGFAYDVVDGIGPYFHAEATWRLEPDGAGCTLHYEGVLHAGFVGWLMWWPTKRSLRGGLLRMLDRMA